MSGDSVFESGNEVAFTEYKVRFCSGTAAESFFFTVKTSGIFDADRVAQGGSAVRDISLDLKFVDIRLDLGIKIRLRHLDHDVFIIGNGNIFRKIIIIIRRLRAAAGEHYTECNNNGE